MIYHVLLFAQAGQPGEVADRRAIATDFALLRAQIPPTYSTDAANWHTRVDHYWLRTFWVPDDFQASADQNALFEALNDEGEVESDLTWCLPGATEEA